MKPTELIAEAKTPDGAEMLLVRQAGALVVKIKGVPLMGSQAHGSEDAMAELACAPLRPRPGARVLVGGLGMGFTLRAALDALGPDAQVVVSELMPALVEWNRGVLGPLANHPLQDRRVELVPGDVAVLLRASRASFDAVLLDVDNGPEAFTTPKNRWLYAQAGLQAIRHALRPGGALVVWSAFPAPAFERQLRLSGFEVEVVPVRARGNRINKGSRHLLFVGRLAGARPR